MNRKMNRAKQDATKDVGGFVGGALKQGKEGTDMFCLVHFLLLIWTA